MNLSITKQHPAVHSSFSLAVKFGIALCLSFILAGLWACAGSPTTTTEVEAATEATTEAQTEAIPAAELNETATEINDTTLSDQAEAQTKPAALDPQAKLLEALAAFAPEASPRGLRVVLQEAAFEYKKSQLTSAAIQQLADLAAALRPFPKASLLVEGFTDSIGGRSYNLNLSQTRADAVQLVLLKQGLAPSAVSSHGYGEAWPVATNVTAEGRQQNRRVELIISLDSAKLTLRD